MRLSGICCGKCQLLLISLIVIAAHLTSHIHLYIYMLTLSSAAGKIYPLEQVFEAIKESQREGRGGKVLLQC